MIDAAYGRKFLGFPQDLLLSVMISARDIRPIVFLSLFSSHVKSSIFNICGHRVHLRMYRERNTDTRHVTGIIRPPITEFPITRPPSPSSPYFGPKGYLLEGQCVLTWACNSLGLYPVLPGKDSLTHVDLMGFIGIIWPMINMCLLLRTVSSLTI